MARLGKLRPGPVAAGLALWDVWRRLTPAQRRQAIRLVREHGPKVVKIVARRSRR